jgi:hypothetical protein
MGDTAARSRVQRIAAIGLALAFSLAPWGFALAATDTRILGFDELVPGTKVTEDYVKDDGIILNGPIVRDTTERPWAAHSPANALVLAQIGEFECEPTLQVDFREPVGRVKVWFGYTFTLPTSGHVTLTLYDDGGQAARADVDAVAGTQPGPIATPLEASAPTKIVKAVVSTDNVSTCALAFDDLEFDRYEPPADLQLGVRGWSLAGDSIMLDLQIANVGGRPSTATSLSVNAPGWSAESIAIGPIEASATTTASLTLPIPTSAFGQTVTLDLELDAKAAGEVIDGNNSVQYALAIPALATPSPSPTEPPSASATPAATLDGGDTGSGFTDWVPLAIVLGAAGAVVTAGWGLFSGRVDWPWGKPPEAKISVDNDGETATVTWKDGRIRLKAEDADPPKSCERGSWYLHREVSADLRGRYLDAITVSTGAGGSARRTTLSADEVTSVAKAISAFKRHPDVTAIDAAARALADRSTTIAGAPPIASLGIVATINGPSAEATFTAYRCVVPQDAATGAFRKLGERQLPIAYRAQRPLGRVATFDGSPRSAAALGRQVAAGLQALAREL